VILHDKDNFDSNSNSKFIKPPPGFKFQDEVLLPPRKNGVSEEQQRLAIQQMFKESEFVVINSQSGKRIPLVHKQTMLGRNSQLVLHVNDISVSSKHACFEMN